MRRLPEMFAIAALATAVAVLLALQVQARQRIQELENETASLQQRLRRLERPAPTPQPTAPRPATEIQQATSTDPTAAAPASQPRDDRPLLRAWALDQLQRQSSEELTALAMSIGASEEQNRVIRDGIHDEIAAWYDLMARWWNQQPGGRPGAPPFEDPEYLRGLREILDSTDRAILPILREEQAREYLRWRVAFQERYRGTVEEGDQP